MRLNLGCGSRVVETWVNVDYGLGAHFARIPVFRAIDKKLGLFTLDWNPRIVLHDLTKRFPWSTSSVDAIYASHVLEHFTRDQGRAFLLECHRVLRAGGIIRILVPDLATIVDSYVSATIPAEYFLERLGVLYESYSNPLRTKLAPFVQFPHKCMYDTASLLSLMITAGFDAEEKRPFESRIVGIEGIELPVRAQDAVIVEGVK